METVTLTKVNAHRVTAVRRKGAADSEPVAFHFRGKRYGYCNYAHLIGEKSDDNILAPSAFSEWEVVEVSHPGYLEEYFEQACRSYNLSSFSPEERGESDIATYEKELHEDLNAMPEDQRSRYTENYKRYFEAMIATNSRCASTMITGAARFDFQRNNRALNNHEKSVTAFRAWRERALEAIRKTQERNKTPEEYTEEAWLAVKADIEDTAATIRGIDNGTLPVIRSIIVSNLYGRLATLANKGNVEIIDRAIVLIKELNATMKKPIVTARHGIFKLPELVRAKRQQLEETANRENKEFVFEGGTVIFNYKEDRLQILFDVIPDNDMRTRLKRETFKWSPRNKAWQRQLTRNAVCAARRLLNITL